MLVLIAENSVSPSPSLRQPNPKNTGHALCSSDSCAIDLVQSLLMSPPDWRMPHSTISNTGLIAYSTRVPWTRSSRPRRPEAPQALKDLNVGAPPCVQAGPDPKRAMRALHGRAEGAMLTALLPTSTSERAHR